MWTWERSNGFWPSDSMVTLKYDMYELYRFGLPWPQVSLEHLCLDLNEAAITPSDVARWINEMAHDDSGSFWRALLAWMEEGSLSEFLIYYALVGSK